MSDTEEFVDIVDETGKIIGRASRSEAHKEGLLHRTVLAQLHDQDGNWILVQQAADRQDPGVHIPPMGGHVDAGESDDDAMRREVNEELGISNFTFKRLGTFIFDRNVLGRRENHYFIAYRVDSGEPLNTNYEISSYRVFSEQELQRLLKEQPASFGPTMFLILKFYPHMLGADANG